MTRKSIYEITIRNDDATTLQFIAKSKLDASFKYADWLEENGTQYGVDETTDFEIEFSSYAYE